ncbi:hypothetical protein LOTGIDRAFT_238268 [Lottia gigantea]|uniref:C-type lectin domain-containing protein n=1 Tax=Lottia gigantea TaxID=225164 RepID=V4AVW0_LOTGI|nr:hypothetical protein LOTGIDRAFT_238268 [Lottia gigantea]ESP01528.1 hypothetical protein LOTGIDRAFT_238268 [Lottia gigantea]
MLKSILLVTLLCSVECQVKIKGRVTCDNVMEFYTDGVLRAVSNDWTQSSAIDVAKTTNVYAFKCTDQGVAAGIKGVFLNGVKTDASWKCLNTFQEGWNMPGFDDSSWPAATLPDPTIWGNRPADLGSVAQWIWTAGGISDSVVYCRKAVSEFVPNSLEACSAELMTSLASLPENLTGINSEIIANITSQLSQLAVSFPGISTFFQTSLNTSLSPINLKIAAAKFLLNDDKR